VDEAKKVAAAYGVVTMLGGMTRAVFLIDKQGKVAWAQEGMPTTDEILAALDAL
jgi:thioredoxin-dependent peroxiredoxin